MRQVTGSMAGVVRGMEGAMKAMDLEKVGNCFHHVVLKWSVELADAQMPRSQQ